MIHGIRRARALAIGLALVIGCSDDRLGTPEPDGGATSSASSSSSSSSSGGGGCAPCGEVFTHPFEGPPVCADDADALDAIRKCACASCDLDCGPFCTEAVPMSADLCVACVKTACAEAAAACAGLP